MHACTEDNVVVVHELVPCQGDQLQICRSTSQVAQSAGVWVTFSFLRNSCSKSDWSNPQYKTQHSKQSSNDFVCCSCTDKKNLFTFAML